MLGESVGVGRHFLGGVFWYFCTSEGSAGGGGEAVCRDFCVVRVVLDGDEWPAELLAGDRCCAGADERVRGCKKDCVNVVLIENERERDETRPKQF